MNGDRLKELEEGFLEGNLTEQEEQRLLRWIEEHPEHYLSPYFRLTTEELPAEMPDFRSRVSLNEKRGFPLWPKVAAVILVIIAAGFLLNDRWLKKKDNENYTQAEIDESYQATMETLSAMAGFLDKGLNETQNACNMSQPFEKLNELNASKNSEQPWSQS